MWSVERKKIIEPRILLAFGVGIVAVVGIILLSLFIRQYSPGHGPNLIDSLIPRSAVMYAHLDLGLLSREGKTLDNNQAWQKLSAKLELVIKKQLPESFDDQRLYNALGQEAAFFVLPDNQGQAFIFESRSAKDFRAVIEEMLPGSGDTIEYRRLSITNNPASIFANLLPVKSDSSETPKVYWSEVRKGLFVVADSVSPVQAVIDVRNKDADALASTVSVFRPGATMFSLWLRSGGFDVAGLLPDTLQPFISSSELSDRSLYFQADIADGALVGWVSDHPLTVLEKLSGGDVANTYRQAQRYFPPSFRLAWLGINLRDVFQSLEAVDVSDDKESVFQWPSFFKNELRFDWAKHILPLVNVPADLLVGQLPVSAGDQQAFLLSLQPEKKEGLDDLANNADALIKNVLSVLSPRKIEKTLSDGTTVMELVPDTQAGDKKEYHIDSQSIQSLWQVQLPGENKALVYGQLDNRIVFSNAPAIIDAIAKLTTTVNAPACLRRMTGQRLLVINRDQLLLAPDYGQYASRVFIADASKEKNIYLTFCIEP